MHHIFTHTGGRLLTNSLDRRHFQHSTLGSPMCSLPPKPALSQTPFIEKLVDSIEIDEIGISPSGDKVAYTVRHFGHERDKPISQLWLVDVEVLGSDRKLTSDTHDHSIKWSPDGKMICFLSNRRDESYGLYGFRISEMHPESISRSYIANYIANRTRPTTTPRKEFQSSISAPIASALISLHRMKRILRKRLERKPVTMSRCLGNGTTPALMCQTSKPPSRPKYSTRMPRSKR
jgi:hypothetical protein